MTPGTSGIARYMTTKYRPSMRMILLMLNLTVLALPLAGLAFFRIFENQLVRETESELISQAAMIGAFVRTKVRPSQVDVAMLPGTGRLAGPSDIAIAYAPIAPQRDLANDEILPFRPDPIATNVPADPLAMAFGPELTGLFLDAQRITLAGLRLLDQNGTVVAGRGDVGLSFAHVPEVRRAIDERQYVSVLRRRISDKQPPPFSSVSRGQLLHVFIAYPITLDDRLLAVAYLSRTPDNILRRLYHARDRVALLAASILTLTLLLGFITSRFIGQPIKTLIERSRLMSSGDASALVPQAHAGTRELAALSDSFSDMAQSLHQRARYARDFATHVSHEFKTPLTSIRGAAELMAEQGDDMPSEARVRFARNILEDADRLRLLVDRLHELARADHAASLSGPCDIHARLVRLGDEQSTPALRINVEGHVPACAISQESFEIVMSNLIANAVQSGATILAIRLATTGEAAEITLADNGSGIAPADQPRIFDPLFTTRHKSGGTGLGLGLVRSILETYRGSITLVPSSADNSIGATFVIRLPLGRP